MLVGRIVVEVEILDSNWKIVSSFLSVEDLSYVYENFLVFVFVMVERSFEFKE